MQGLDIAGPNSGRRGAAVSVDDVAKAYEALLAHGFKDTQIQEAMQVLSFWYSGTLQNIRRGEGGGVEANGWI